MTKTIKLRMTLQMENYIIDQCEQRGIIGKSFTKCLEYLIKNPDGLNPINDNSKAFGRAISLQSDVYRLLNVSNKSPSNAIHNLLNYQIIKPSRRKVCIDVMKDDLKKFTELGDGDPSLGIKLALITCRVFDTKYSIDTDKAIYKMLTDIGQGDPSAGLKLALGITE